MTYKKISHSNLLLQGVTLGNTRLIFFTLNIYFEIPFIFWD